MKALLQSTGTILWQNIKQHRWIIGRITIAVLLIIGLSFAVWRWGWDWLGLNGGFSKVTTTTTSTGSKTTVTEKPPGKTLWDVLQLLIVPVVLSLLGVWFTRRQQQRDWKLEQTQHDSDQRFADQRAQVEREIAADNQRETALQKYLDDMGELLLDKNVRNPAHEEARTLARVKTLTILPRLDGKRRSSVLQFLYEAKLLEKENPLVSLKGADFSEVYFLFADLREINLDGAKLYKANFEGSDLRGASLCDTDLSDATLCLTKLNASHLCKAFLVGADLLWADLVSADLTSADLASATLISTDLTSATLTGADLGDANLDEAHLNKANLSKAYLGDEISGEWTGVHRSGNPHLDRADLRGVTGLTKEQLAACKALGAIIDEEVPSLSSECSPSE